MLRATSRWCFEVSQQDPPNATARQKFITCCDAPRLRVSVKETPEFATP
jgi:hypothetical protein